MQQKEIIIGIDISKKTLDVVLSFEDELEHVQIENTQAGIKRFYAKLLKKGRPLFTCFENTGVYSYSLCLVMQELEITYCMLNPLMLKKSMGIVRGKSDKIDAYFLADFGKKRRSELLPTQLPLEDIMELKLLLSERVKYLKSIKNFTATSENEGQVPPKMFKRITLENNRTLNYLKKSKKKVEEKMLQLIKKNETLNKQFDLMQSVPGVGPQTAIELLVSTNAFTSFTCSRKFACYAGIAPFPYQSGSSIKGRTKVSHLANKKIKATLSMAALSAKTNDPQLKKYYDRKKKEGKNGMLIMNAIRNKLTHRIFATIKRGTPYVKVKNHAA